jgi:hypothetical protein
MQSDGGPSILLEDSAQYLDHFIDRAHGAGNGSRESTSQAGGIPLDDVDVRAVDHAHSPAS